MRNRVCGTIASMTKKRKKRRTLNYMSGIIYLYKAVKLVSRKKKA